MVSPSAPCVILPGYSIGEKCDKSVRKYSRQIPDHEEGYYLSVNEKEIVLAGNDERGTYCLLYTSCMAGSDS